MNLLYKCNGDGGEGGGGGGGGGVGGGGGGGGKNIACEAVIQLLS